MKSRFEEIIIQDLTICVCYTFISLKDTLGRSKTVYHDVLEQIFDKTLDSIFIYFFNSSYNKEKLGIFIYYINPW